MTHRGRGKDPAPTRAFVLDVQKAHEGWSPGLEKVSVLVSGVGGGEGTGAAGQETGRQVDGSEPPLSPSQPGKTSIIAVDSSRVSFLTWE